MIDFSSELSKLKKGNLYRTLRMAEGFGSELTIGRTAYLNFSSNDYLSLAGNPEVKKSAVTFIKNYGSGSTSSPLICGYSSATAQVEKKIKKLKKAQAALLFSSGYLANLGCLHALSAPQTIFLMDRLAHASIVDGILLGGAKWRRYRHNDLEDLERLLKTSKSFKHRVIVTESVFSMEGDTAPLEPLYQLALKYNAQIVIDEAHATGVFGPGGRGLCSAQVIKSERTVVIGTFGKALGNFGAFYAGSRVFRDYLVNRARSYIFTTALPPAVLGGICGALDYLTAHPDAGTRLLQKAGRLRSRLTRLGVPLVPGTSQIICILTKDNEKTVHLSRYLQKKGILAVAIRPPTVAPGTARIRLAVTLDHQECHLERLLEAIAGYQRRYRL